MTDRDEDKSKPGRDLWFLDELEADTEQLGGKVAAADWTPSDAPPAAERGFLEFDTDGLPLRSAPPEEEPSEPVRIFVGRTTLPVASSRHPEDHDPSPPDRGPSAERAQPPRGIDVTGRHRAEIGGDAPSERWAGLGSLRRREETSDREPMPSWMGAPAPVNAGFDAETDDGAERDEDWNQPLLKLSFGDGPARVDDELDELPAGDDEGELPVHEPFLFGDEAATPAISDDDAGFPEEEHTGQWNRLDLFSPGEPAREDRGAAPVWQAKPDARAEEAPSEVWTTAHGVGASKEEAKALVEGGRSGPVRPPPIEAMGSVLQEELNTRTPVQPKAVVLKTLDQIPQPSGPVDDPSDVRSRVPPRRRSGTVQTEEEPVQVSSNGGTGRLLLLVAVALLCTGGAMWQWRSTLFPSVGLVSLDEPAVPVTERAQAHDNRTDSDAAPQKAPQPASDAPPSPTPAPSAATPSVESPEPPELEAPSAVPEEARAASEEEREASRRKRRTDLQTGVLFVTTDRRASVYVGGKKLATTPMELPGLELSSGHHDLKVVPHGGGRTYRSDVRIDAGRVRKVELRFNK